MAISKITLNGVIQMDLTGDTVTAQTLLDDITAHGADGNAITGEYVAPTPRTSSDVTVSGATVTIPAGAYSTQVQKSVASGTEGTPTATKGAVSSHSISVTPSVTNSAGYISGGTHTGTAVTVSASELVSGSETKTSNGTYNVTNLAELVVNVSGGGGASNIVMGDFTAGEESSVQTITTTYTGNGYIIALLIWGDGGVRGNAGLYNVTHQNATVIFSAIKFYASQIPNYSQNNTNYNGATVLTSYKSTSGTTYSHTGSSSPVIYTTADPVGSSTTGVITITSDKVFKVYVSPSGSGYGFLSGVKYNYVAVFSE